MILFSTPRRYFLILIVFLVLLTVQWIDNPLKKAKRACAEGDHYLLQGNFGSSILAYREALSADPTQAGLSMIVQILEEATSGQNANDSTTIIMTVGEEAIRQQRLVLAERIFRQLMRRSEAFFDAERRLRLVQWMKDSSDKNSSPFNYYDDVELRKMFRQLVNAIPPPQLLDKSFTDQTAESIGFNFAVNRVYPGDYFFVRWYDGSREISAERWLFDKLIEDVRLSARLLKPPTPVTVELFYKKTLWLRTHYPEEAEGPDFIIGGHSRTRKLNTLYTSGSKNTTADSSAENESESSESTDQQNDQESEIDEQDDRDEENDSAETMESAENKESMID